MYTCLFIRFLTGYIYICITLIPGSILFFAILFCITFDAFIFYSICILLCAKIYQFEVSIFRNEYSNKNMFHKVLYLNKKLHNWMIKAVISSYKTHHAGTNLCCMWHFTHILRFHMCLNIIYYRNKVFSIIIPFYQGKKMSL